MQQTVFLTDIEICCKKVAEQRVVAIFGYYVADPITHGVVEFDKGGNALGIE